MPEPRSTLIDAPAASRASSLLPSASPKGDASSGTPGGSMAAQAPVALHVIGIGPPHEPSEHCPCRPVVGLRDASGDALVLHRPTEGRTIEDMLCEIGVWRG